MLTTLPNRVSALFADPFNTVFRNIDREFSPNGGVNGPIQRKVAPLSMWGDADAVHIEMDVPGIALADLSVSVENGLLMIRGRRRAIERQSETIHEERFFGEFERNVSLNDRVDPSTIEATLQDGVLHIKLSKKREAQRQQVSINYRDNAHEKLVEPTA